MAEVEFNLTLVAIKAEIAGAGNNARIVYGANTTWWRHRDNPRFKHRSPDGSFGLPCDPLGGVLLEIRGIGECLSWIDQAADSPERYGKHGVTAFLATHAENCREGGRYSAFRSWDEANEAIDRFLARGQAGNGS